MTDAVEAAGITTFTCGATSAANLGALARLATHIRRIRPELIHTALTHANVAGRMIGLIQRVPVIGSTATIELERAWHRAVERATIRRDRAHIVNGTAVADYVTRVYGLPRGRIHIVPPSVTVPESIDRSTARAELGISAAEFVVAWCGRFDRVKQLPVLIRIAQHLYDQAAMCFVLAGDGPDRPRVEKMLRESPVPVDVRLLDWQDSISPVLTAADAFLFPSSTEGMPNAVLEALAHGVPVVGSDIPALRDLKRAGAPLTLVSQLGFRPYAHELLNIFNATPSRKLVKQRAISDWAREHLRPEATVDTTLRVYESVLHRTRRR